MIPAGSWFAIQTTKRILTNWVAVGVTVTFVSIGLILAVIILNTLAKVFEVCYRILFGGKRNELFVVSK